jgi:hypothetical protein
MNLGLRRIVATAVSESAGKFFSKSWGFHGILYFLNLLRIFEQLPWTEINITLSQL